MRLQGDWSSDVCSSDLAASNCRLVGGEYLALIVPADLVLQVVEDPEIAIAAVTDVFDTGGDLLRVPNLRSRSEERRVGKECGCRGVRCQLTRVRVGCVR